MINLTKSVGRAFCVAVFILLLLAACQAKSETSVDSKAEDSQEGGVTHADVTSCLGEAGLTVETEEVPRLSGIKAIGVKAESAGNIKPGDHAAAVFVFSSEDEAKKQNSSLIGFFAETRLGGNAVVAFDPAPSPEFLDAVGRCAFSDEG